MYKYRFSLSIGLVGCEHVEIMEYDDFEPSEDELEEAYIDWRNNFLEGGYVKINA